MADSAAVGLHALVGHETLRGHLGQAFVAGTLPASLLMYGPAGVGKQRLALWTAQLLLCRQPQDGVPCDVCVACGQVRRLEHPDLHWFFPVVKPKGSSSPEKLKAGLEDARRQGLRERAKDPLTPSWHSDLRAIYLAAVKTLREFASKRPATGDRQVFIVGDAEALVPQESSPEAANALLKVLEEPPEGTTFILTASEPETLLPTIRSRTVAMHVPSLPAQVVQDFLVEFAGAETDAATRAAVLSGGSIGKALAYLPNDSEVGPLEAVRREAWRVLEAAAGDKPEGPYRAALGQSPAGARTLGPLFDHLGVWVRDLAAVSVGAEGTVVNIDALVSLRTQVERGVGAAGLSKALDRIEYARVLTQGNVNPQLVLFGLMHELGPLLRPGVER